MNGEIVHLDLKISVSDFESAAKEEENDIAASSSRTVTHKISECGTRNGMSLYKIDVETDGNSQGQDTAIIYCEKQANGDMKFYNFGLKRLEEKCYERPNVAMDWDEDNPFFCLCNIMLTVAKKVNGTFVYVTSIGVPIAMVDGQTVHATDLAVIDRNTNKVYAFNNNGISGDIEGDGSITSEFRINKLIFDWLKEHPDLQEEVKKIPSIPDKVNLIGKYLIQLKLTDKIEQEEFIDIFRQAASFACGNITDPMVAKIYKLLI